MPRSSVAMIPALVISFGPSIHMPAMSVISRNGCSGTLPNQMPRGEQSSS